MNINEIATIANRIKKPNKSMAFDIIKSIIENNGQINEHDTVKLYAFFLPPIPANPKTPEQWISKAVAKKDIRSYLNQMHVSNGRLVATDGHRLHFTDTDLDDGYYDQNLNKLDIEDRYPDIERVIPADLPVYHVDKMDLVVSGNMTAYKINNSHYQKKYIDQALSGLDNPVFHCADNDDSKLLISDGNRHAVIMPCKI